MSEDLAQSITNKILTRMERSKHPIPVGISNRHLHLTQEHFETLFGKGAAPKKYRDVRQPGYYACHEAVTVAGPKGQLKNVRLVGPYRPQTQVELSRADALVLGISPPVRESGQLRGSAPAKLIGPRGEVDLKEGVILAMRHVHLHPREAQAIGIEDKEMVRVRAGAGGGRALVFEDVVCRVSDKFALEFHVDTEEANAAGLKTGDIVYLV